MSREAIGRAAVRLYPAAVRESRGSELVGTLLDAGDASWRAYLGQLGSLVRSGLLARARLELTRPLAEIGASTLCWIAVMSVVWQLVTVVGIELRWGGGPGSGTETDLYSYILPVSILVLFTLGRHRTTGVLGLGWVAIFLHQHPMLPSSGFIADVPLQAAGFAMLAIRPRAARSAGRLLWLVPAVVFLVYQVTLLGQLSGVGRTTPVLVALLLLPWAPSLALGTAITWGLTGLFYLSMYQALPTYSHLLVEAIELLATVPLALAGIATARAALTRNRLRNR